MARTLEQGEQSSLTNSRSSLAISFKRRVRYIPSERYLPSRANNTTSNIEVTYDYPRRLIADLDTTGLQWAGLTVHISS